MKHCSTIFVLLCFCFLAETRILAQPPLLPKKDYSQQNLALQGFFFSKDSLRKNHFINESMVDLVEAWTTDSVIQNPREHHRMFLIGTIMNWLNFHWKASGKLKRKFVGAVSKAIDIYDPEMMDEYDINLDIVPHLKKYQDLIYEQFQGMYYSNRIDTNKFRGKAPFIRPTSENLDHYAIHAELTPYHPKIVELNRRFYPAIPGVSAEDHPSMGMKKPVVGIYGPVCLDCNHNCHPEMHPYEWIWWLDLHPGKDRDINQINWYIGLFKDRSNNMKNWTRGCRNGVIKLPIVLPAHARKLKIYLESLVYDGLNAGSFSQSLENLIPADAVNIDGTSQEIEIPAQNSFWPVSITTNRVLPSGSVKIWVESLEFDEEQNLWKGKIGLAASTEELYTARLSVKWK